MNFFLLFFFFFGGLGGGEGEGWGEGGGLGRTIQKNCCLEKTPNLEKKDILGN